ncbi:alpha/beta hydrolase family protein [Pseudoxanthomonas daejeonensis]|nr:prolyl oligopeptidase family serine peptidase [Pseudoxanthomonas daejeonensis]
MQVERVAIAGSGLQGTRVQQARVPGALFIHGWTGSRQDMAGPMMAAAAAGFACLDYDLHGHRATADQRAQVTLRGSLADAVDACDSLAAMQNVDGDAIAVVGSSFGGWPAALLTTQRPVRWLALRVPALYPDQWWDRSKESLDDAGLAAYRHSRRDRDTDQALAACAAFEGEVLLVWSGHDELLPEGVSGSFQVAFPRAQALTVRKIRNADHGLSGGRSRSEYRSLLGAWLGSALAARRRRGLLPVLEPDAE